MSERTAPEEQGPSPNIPHWEQTPLEFDNGREGYIHYLTGVAILNNPYSLFAIKLHQKEVNQEKAPGIAKDAEQFIYDGLRTVIANANPNAERRWARAAKRFQYAAPIIGRMVTSAFEDQRARITYMNPALLVPRPNPLRDQVLYSYLCSGQTVKILTERLMVDIPVHDLFQEVMEGRTLQGVKRFGNHGRPSKKA